MVNLRPRSKARAVALRATPKVEPTGPTSSTTVDNWDLSEATLRKLPRAELQKIAMAHKVKANVKSELIIQQLSSLRIPKRTRPANANEDREEGPSQKRFKRKSAFEKGPDSPIPESQKTLPDAQSPQNTSHSNIRCHANRVDAQPPTAGPSAPQPTPSANRGPAVPAYDRDLFSGTESEMTEEEQLDFATPISSRSGTPFPANVKNLDRCVTIMQEISAKDVALLNEVTDVREAAAKLRKRARDIRDLVKAESGRRERMEAYFRYWQEIEPTWHKQWLYGEKMVPDYKIQLEELDGPSGPPTIPSHPQAQKAQSLGGRERPATPGPARKPTPSPEQLKQKRQAIISKQEAEQRQLEALWREELRSENSSESSEDVDAPELGEGSSLANLPSTDQNTVKNLTISFESTTGVIEAPAPSP